MIKTGNKNFWIAQSIGWSLLASSNLILQIFAGIHKELLILNAIIPILVGFLLTSIYRYFIRKLDWHKWNFNKTLTFLFVSTLILTIVFMVTVYIIVLIIKGLESLTIVSFLGSMFSFILILLTWNLIYFSIHYFNNWNQAEIVKWQLATEIKDAQLGSLKSQINPHFVFNTINNIRSLILEDEEKAREMLLNFSDLFRYSLKNSNQTRVSLEDELEIVNQYFELLSIQYEDKLKYKIQVEEGVESLKVPPMVLQLLVENSIKHGISQNVEGGYVLIDINKKEEFLNIKVQNSGVMDKSSNLEDKLGVGLGNIRRRLELIYNGRASLSLKEIENNVIVFIKIPLE